eukprot:CAMPEP_0197828658 /NCGR_PEP_ID=MMETSP1437-20131217/5196_1 /TAXON_ID=49252 ORGANISM="Eucampia antarctica, Strain CCMP1452" /NCGR_SAMPLE_ID=MMETSP1437 /ASSEMBLY_ACC=CAM_ASM_001096 /LENGTH=63 /DNA_ID=CAMNT_0043429957 /DNA_START=228 /DNA_END=416 /DNA_ORIENTATION=+
MAGDHSCGARINWLQTSEGSSLSELQACTVIGGDEYPDICGACDPATCQYEIELPSSKPTTIS